MKSDVSAAFNASWFSPPPEQPWSRRDQMKTFKNWSCSTVIWCKLGPGSALRWLRRIFSAWSQDMGVAVLLGSEALQLPNFDRGWMKLNQTAWTSSTSIYQHSHSQLLVFNTACNRGKCVGVCVGSVLCMGSTEQSVYGEISTFPHIATEERKCPYVDETNPHTTPPPIPPHINTHTI